ncbi:hypothetical protein BDR03DRAFT_964178 [Suillus americanus]|nr:hypothetical protein BDR03DRAFT_964178 [Suillus americanus]
MAGSAWTSLHVTHVRALLQNIGYPDPTLVVGASNEETGTTDEDYLVHQFLMTLNF